jgi:catechol 2,3-dioxygenase-like lactoylglutathione lyase family enzyme
MLGNYPVTALFPCTDLSAARKFYGETLGLNEIEIPGIPEEAREMAANDIAMFACGGGTTLGLYRRDTPTKADHTAAGFMVPNLDEVVDDLISRGVTFEVYEDMPDVEWDDRGIATAVQGYRSAWITDPEGNILAVNEMTG